jgi:hypothetical protein
MNKPASGPESVLLLAIAGFASALFEVVDHGTASADGLFDLILPAA